jgi:hypothetical protein
VALEDVLEHTAYPLLKEEEGELVEGERDDLPPSEGVPFDCALFLPLGGEEASPRGGRQVRRPTLLYIPVDRDGEAVVLHPEDELLIVAAELNAVEGRDADALVRWQVEGRPQPAGRPGDDLAAVQATLVRVED